MATESPGVALPDPFLPYGRGLVDPERRQAMIAEAAYYYAEHRGFEPGHELDDWLAARSQIDAALTVALLHATYGE
jgi:hypothetical protein